MLDLRSRAEVEGRRRCAGRLRARRASAMPASRVFWCRRWSSGVEAIVGARNDALYGPLLLIGAGGMLVELARDAALRLLPVEPGEIATMVDGLKLKRLLDGYRGRPAADRGALEKTALRDSRNSFSIIAARIEDIEINPLMIRTSGAVAVDVRVLWRQER